MPQGSWPPGPSPSCRSVSTSGPARARMVERALAEGYRAVRIACAPAAALTVQTWPAYMQVEREIGADCQALPLCSLCQ